jgi:hypothetical protein
MQKEVREAFRVQFKWTVLEYAKVCRTDAKAYRDFDVTKSTFYGWKRAVNKEGKAGLARKKHLIVLGWVGLLIFSTSAQSWETPRRTAKRIAREALLEASKLSLEDKAQIIEFERFKKSFGSQIWPGFGAEVIPLVLYSRDYDFLIWHPDPPVGWAKAIKDSVMGISYYTRPSVNPQAFAVRVGDLWAGSLNTLSHMDMSLESQVRENVPAEKITPALLEMMKFTPAQHVVVLMHEAFHAYQATHFCDRFQAALDIYTHEKDYPYEDQAFKDAWNREGQYLWEALREKDDLRVRASLEGFLNVRSQRRKDQHMDQPLISFEQELEWLEGLAKYVEMRSAELGSEEKTSQNYKDYRVARGRLRMDFYARLRHLGEQDGDLRFYLSGAAQAMLLDHLCPEWKTVLSKIKNIPLERMLIREYRKWQMQGREWHGYIIKRPVKSLIIKNL